jgi:antirestriction protein ArdC
VSQAEETEESSGRRFFARGYGVFNAAQIDGYTPPPLPRIIEPERIAHAEAFFDGLSADIRHGGAHAYYRPSVKSLPSVTPPRKPHKTLIVLEKDRI